ncbi:MAG: dihydroorotate dehydrogenase electron transfer subunit [Solobacterium sp.]|nr:dihydroorotate dehydrogenase electron transfer subunit [Solobacterium sp.]
MKQKILRVCAVRQLTGTMFELKLSGIEGMNILPGQFVNVKTEGNYLRRPISVCNAEGDILTLVFKVVGRGTEAMSRLSEGDPADVLLELGNGYDLESCGEHPLLIGGGAGIPPMYYLARQLKRRGIEPTVILGFNTASECYYIDEFRAVSGSVKVTTADGTCGIRGFVTDALEECTGAYACGPMPMMKALYKTLSCPCQFSLEERMGCGFGACMGCTIKTKSGNRRVCKDGPVFRKEDLLWED